jgi:hypothetical protein
MSEPIENVVVEEPLNDVEPKKKRGPTKKKKEPVPEKKACRVPKLRTPHKSTLWALHIYQIIKEFAPILLEQEAVIDAYNVFVDRLLTHDDILETYVPSRSLKYRSGIIYEKLTFKRYLDGNIPGHFKDENDLWRFPELKEKHARIVEDIKSAYKPLYDLFKREVVPQIEKKLHEERVKRSSPGMRRDIEAVQTAIQLEEQRHKNAIERYHELLSDKIQELKELLEGFKPTEFTD